jgi:hypothetical protein
MCPREREREASGGDGQAGSFETLAYLKGGATQLAALLPEEVQVARITVSGMKPG